MRVTYCLSGGGYYVSIAGWLSSSLAHMPFGYSSPLDCHISVGSFLQPVVASAARFLRIVTSCWDISLPCVLATRPFTARCWSGRCSYTAHDPGGARCPGVCGSLPCFPWPEVAERNFGWFTRERLGTAHVARCHRWPRCVLVPAPANPTTEGVMNHRHESSRILKGDRRWKRAVGQPETAERRPQAVERS